MLGASLLTAAVLLDPIFPINKLIWTSSFALLSAGFSFMTLAFLAWALQLRWFQRLSVPLQILGGNAVLAFLLATLFSKLGEAPWFSLGGATLTAQAWGDAITRKLVVPQQCRRVRFVPLS